MAFRDEHTASPALPPVLECRDLAVRYGRTPVLSGTNLTVTAGELLALLGPSGAGKSTLLHAVAGFVDPSAGQILLGGRPVATPEHAEPPERRGIGFVFQNYALWPHLSVLDTVAYPLRRAGLNRRTAAAEARTLLRRLRIDHLAGRRPGQLSGGEQQRVGLARALARHGRLYLFDEPTAHLDATLRTVAQDQIVAMLRATGAAAVYATHDGAEALAVADRLILLRGGTVVQQGIPVEVYERPVDAWAARLTGPASVLAVHTRPVRDGRAETVVDGTGTGVLVPGSWCGRALLVRPGWAKLGGPLGGRVQAARYTGGHTSYLLGTAAGSLLVSDDGPPRLRPGEHTTWSLARGHPLAEPAGGLAPADEIGQGIVEHPHRP